MSWHTNNNALPLSISSYKAPYDNTNDIKYLHPVAEKLAKNFELPSWVVQYMENDVNKPCMFTSINNLQQSVFIYYDVASSKYEIKISFHCSNRSWLPLSKINKQMSLIDAANELEAYDEFTSNFYDNVDEIVEILNSYLYCCEM